MATEAQIESIKAQLNELERQAREIPAKIDAEVERQVAEYRARYSPRANVVPFDRSGVVLRRKEGS